MEMDAKRTVKWRECKQREETRWKMLGPGDDLAGKVDPSV